LLFIVTPSNIIIPDAPIALGFAGKVDDDDDFLIFLTILDYLGYLL
jgi:hypothetical protein